MLLQGHIHSDLRNGNKISSVLSFQFIFFQCSVVTGGTEKIINRKRKRKIRHKKFRWVFETAFVLEVVKRPNQNRGKRAFVVMATFKNMLIRHVLTQLCMVIYKTWAIQIIIINLNMKLKTNKQTAFLTK